jgi:hypothetical protein
VNLCNSILIESRQNYFVPARGTLGPLGHFRFFLLSHTVLISCWHFLSKDFELIQCLSDVITNLQCQSVFLYSMDQIHGADSSAFLLRCCVRAKTNQLNVIIVEHIIQHEVILCFCESRTLFNWFSVASLLKTWISHQLTISNVLP